MEESLGYTDIVLIFLGNINSAPADKRLSVIGGDSGVIEIKSKDLTFGEVSVSTATLGLGKAGLIDIQSDTIKMEGGDSHLKRGLDHW